MCRHACFFVATFGEDCWELDYMHAGLGLRGEYRVLVTSYPFASYSDSLHPVTVIGQPTVGLSYTFGRR